MPHHGGIAISEENAPEETVDVEQLRDWEADTALDKLSHAIGNLPQLDDDA